MSFFYFCLIKQFVSSVESRWKSFLVLSYLEEILNFWIFLFPTFPLWHLLNFKLDILHFIFFSANQQWKILQYFFIFCCLSLIYDDNFPCEFQPFANCLDLKLSLMFHIFINLSSCCTKQNNIAYHGSKIREIFMLRNFESKTSTRRFFFFTFDFRREFSDFCHFLSIIFIFIEFRTWLKCNFIVVISRYIEMFEFSLPSVDFIFYVRNIDAFLSCQTLFHTRKELGQ